jgi:RND family efflux transporter MFP subunit
VSDYEEYSGRIEKGVVRVQFPSPRIVQKTYFKVGTVVREGDLLGETVPDDDPKLIEARKALGEADMRRSVVSAAKDPANRAKLEAEWKAAQDEFDRAVRAAPHVNVMAPISGKLTDIWSPGMGTVPRRCIELAVGPDAIHEDGTVAMERVATITAPDAMIVSFDVPERTVLAHRRMPDRKPNWELSLPVVLRLADEQSFSHRGKVVSVAEGIDPQTHSQRWQAVVPNKDGIFMPGLSVHVRVVTSEPHEVMLVPTEALLDDPEGKIALVVNNRNVVERRKVKIGRLYDGFSEVVNGLGASDWVQ